MKPTTPLVSIIIPTFNRAHLIGETLDSVLAQTYENWECIVVDDGSTDNTAAVMAGYMAKDSRFQYHHRPKDRLPGGNAARNYGFELSKGEFVQWFDSDDLMMEAYIETRLAAFKEEMQLVICSGYSADEALNIRRQIMLDEEAMLFKEYVLWKLRILTPSVLFRRTFLEDKLLFDEGLVRGQETAFFSKLFFVLEKKDYIILNLPLFYYRQHSITKTTANKKYLPSFKHSMAQNSLANLKRGLILNDREICNYHYRFLVGCFFQGIRNKDFNTSRYILRELQPLLRKRNVVLWMQFWTFGNVFLKARKSIHVIEKKMKHTIFIS